MQDEVICRRILTKILLSLHRVHASADVKVACLTQEVFFSLGFDTHVIGSAHKVCVFLKGFYLQENGSLADSGFTEGKCFFQITR